MHVTVVTPGGDMTIVATSASGFMAAQGQVRALPGPCKEEMLNQIKRDVVYIAQHVDDSSFIFATNGTEKIGDVDAQILDINAQGARMRWYIDPQKRPDSARSLSGHGAVRANRRANRSFRLERLRWCDAACKARQQTR